MAARYCSLVDSMLSTAETQAAGAEQIGRAQATLSPPELLELRLQGVASDACALSLRDLDAAASEVLQSSSQRTGGTTSESPEALLEVTRTLRLPLQRSASQALSRRMLMDAQGLPVAPERPADLPDRLFAGRNEVWCRSNFYFDSIFVLVLFYSISRY